jgi:hypothetical protein
LAAPETQLIDGIHLPNIMWFLSTLIVAGRTPARRSRRQSRAPKPALQGSFAGAGIVPLLLQQNANQAAAPGCMLFAHVDGLVKRGAIRRGLLGRTAFVVRRESLLPALTKPAHQMINRAHR